MSFFVIYSRGIVDKIEKKHSKKRDRKNLKTISDLIKCGKLKKNKNNK